MNDDKHQLVISSLNGDYIQVCPDLYLFKTSEGPERYSQSYGLIRNDRLILIDAVHEVNKTAISELRDKYPLSALLLTDSAILNQAWGSIDDLQSWFSCPVYAYPSTVVKKGINNIISAKNFLGAYGLDAIHIPGFSTSAIIIHDMFKKYLFTGNSFIGSDYRQKNNVFAHPEMTEEKWSLFYNAWKGVKFSEVDAIFPLQGKFKVNLASWAVEKDRIMIKNNCIK